MTVFFTVRAGPESTHRTSVENVSPLSPEKNSGYYINNRENPVVLVDRKFMFFFIIPQ